jgi:hypothetical protein
MSLRYLARSCGFHASPSNDSKSNGRHLGQAIKDSTGDKMPITPESIDEYLFNFHFVRFLAHVHKQSGRAFVSFNANPYTEHEEGYKYELHANARRKLDLETWRLKQIGTGVIARSVISAIELPANNLVEWRPKYGESRRPHQDIHKALEDPAALEKIEQLLYALYIHDSDPSSFEDSTRLFGRKYPLLAYLFFLKDRSRYLPIAPEYFDHSFNMLGVNFRTSMQCSWDNYVDFIRLVTEARELLAERVPSEVSLLDAHSFLWMLSKQMKGDDSASTIDYATLPPRDREAVIQARIGQGRYRRELIAFWERCAVTGCAEHALLRASHIKPWTTCDAFEARDPFNGLLLVPSLDAAFDAGYISFENSGEIMISSRFQDPDAVILGIDSQLRMSRVDDRHRPYLEYHRTHCFAL